MTTLGAALNSTAVQMRIDAAVSDPADYYQIDDEVIQLLSDRQAVADQLAGDRTLWRVERGVSGTTAASHLNGATLTPLYPQIASSQVETGGSGVTVDNTVDPPFAATTLQFPAGTMSDAGGGVAAVGLVLQRIGPFHVTFTTTDLQGDGAIVGPELVAGTMILRSWFEPTVEWTFDNGLTFVTHFLNTSGQTFTQYSASGSSLVVAAGAETNLARLIDLVQVLPAPDHMTVLVEAANITAGEANVYAIIATPAA